MALFKWLDRLLSKGAKPAEPASSTFGAGAERRAVDEAREDAYEFEVEKQKGRPRGF